MGKIEDPKPMRWNKEAFNRLPELFGVDRLRLELIDGEVITMPPQNEPHTYAILAAQSALQKVFGSGFIIRVQMPLNLAGPHQPEPDIAVIKGSLKDNRKHPRSAALLVEVSDSTLRYDRVRKGSLYASAKILNYWIINLLDRQVEVRRDPKPDAQAEFGATFSDISVYRAGDTISPLASPGSKIRIGSLLP